MAEIPQNLIIIELSDLFMSVVTLTIICKYHNYKDEIAVGIVQELGERESSWPNQLHLKGSLCVKWRPKERNLFVTTNFCLRGDNKVIQENYKGRAYNIACNHAILDFRCGIDKRLCVGLPHLSIVEQDVDGACEVVYEIRTEPAASITTGDTIW